MNMGCKSTHWSAGGSMCGWDKRWHEL